MIVIRKGASVNNTPEFWGEYLAYLDKYNKSCHEMDKRNLEYDYEEYLALPWYERIFATDPKRDIWRDTHWDKSPSLLDYYHWDVRIRRNKHEKV